MIESEELVWVENPYQWDYIRKGTYMTTVRRGKMSIKDWGSAYKLIGYTNERKNDKGIQVYCRTVFYLKSHDKGCPKENEVPTYRDGIDTPTEAIDPRLITISDKTRVIREYNNR